MSTRNWVIYSADEYRNDGAGFWNDEDGWTTFESAARYDAADSDIPNIGVKCQWLDIDGMRDYTVLTVLDGHRQPFCCVAAD